MMKNEKSKSFESVYHVTVLSNLARAYDKYSRSYFKSRIPESRHPDRFFVLSESELDVGLQKAQKLLAKLNLAGDKIILLHAQVDPEALRKDHESGLGRYLAQDHLIVESLSEWLGNNSFKSYPLEDALADSLAISVDMKAYDELQPRSFSYLPVAIGCEAQCPFCFSKASVSSDQLSGKPDFLQLRHLMKEAKARGAERAVITGGGEPGLLPFSTICDIIQETRKVFQKTILITNGYFLSNKPGADTQDLLKKLDQAGLSVLSVSRHHWDRVQNASIFNLDTNTERIAQVWSALKDELQSLRMRWVCVLQKGAVDSEAALEKYLDWAAQTGVREICFKELYVSTSRESVYHSHAENLWSQKNQVPLSLILDFASRHGWKKISELPWGAPIFVGKWKGQELQIAAYTEPSLFWERSHGLARSWNYMSDGRVFVSLEDRNSEVMASGLSKLSSVS